MFPLLSIDFSADTPTVTRTRSTFGSVIVLVMGVVVFICKLTGISFSVDGKPSSGNCDCVPDTNSISTPLKLNCPLGC
ncbi:hypothetical protein [Gilliamella apicola]|uniref:hypothetical protein n=1 Tax=Gilliamella apicola TaxID=1196095 RepID=UPI00209C5C32|nr:hypothetical protein [Gilliamella apicola]